MFRIVTTLAIFAATAGQAQITGEPYRYSVNGMEFEGYVARNANLEESRGTVMIVHDWDGLTDYEKRRADMLAAQGYTAFAADVYGADNLPQSMDENRERSGELYTDREMFRARLMASLEAARAVGGGEGGVLVIGYCFGGAAVLEAARAGADAAGFVSFHGGLETPEGQDWSQASGPVLVLHGTADPVSGPAALATLVEELEAAGVDHEAQLYGGARHAYTVWGADDYDLEADQASWLALQMFLEERL
ncbi:dienelactone hydrolase family protein [Roseitranquillus sediminis]|uniref:dienelactone hydrolase family protein n=1 Tax=Roseitranquillus sediminis TaxID=2809051 RepID=UPI001D0C0845|nr:dienelactone hydrolase family protein [Roseitranquillus sediminis]MBM9594255.1 dienelactone hydrolase family protein [Roseitranquillus sediminis]